MAVRNNKIEHFFGYTLDNTNREILWDSSETEGNIKYWFHKLFVTQILLGPNAIEGETNIIEVTCLTANGIVTVPLAILIAGKTDFLLPSLLLPAAEITFKLVQGRGPIHIMGKHSMIYRPIPKEWKSMDDLIDLAIKEGWFTQNNETDDSDESDDSPSLL